MFDHSWRLLTQAEGKTLAWMSTFRGGCMAEEAGAVTGAGWPILLGLVDKSLLMAQANGRYDLHELTRQYATGKLSEMSQEPAARQKHFEVYRILADLLDSQLHGPKGISAYARMDSEESASLSLALIQGAIMIAYPLGNLGLLALQRGQLSEALHRTRK